MTSIEDKLNDLKGFGKIINSLDNEVKELLSQNKFLANKKTEIEQELESLRKERENLIIDKKKLACDIENKELEQNYLVNNKGAISLGINNLSVRNTEATHDALSFFEKKCPYCNKNLFVTTNRKQFEVDHFFPVAKGGQDVPWNLLPVCQRCNRKKRDNLPHTFLDINTFKKVSDYLKSVHQKFLDEAIDSYTFKEKLKELIEKENTFVRRNIRSDFISSLLYLADEHNIIREEEIANITQSSQSKTNKMVDAIVEYLNRKIPEDWCKLDLQKRREFLEGDELITEKNKNLYLREFVCIAEIWCECLGKDRKEMNRYKTREINDIMKGLDGWEQESSTKNFAIYGKQRFYARCEMKRDMWS